MHKQSIKNFVYSFLFSLLAVFCVNKVFMHAPETESSKSQKIIKPHNISLFSPLSDAYAPVVAKRFVDVSEIEKLTAEASTQIPEDDKAKNETVLSTGSLPPPPSGANRDIIVTPDLRSLTTDAALVETVLQTEQEPKKLKKERSSVNTDLAAAEEIILEKENVILKVETANDYEESGVVYADISDTFSNTVAEIIEDTPSVQNILYAPEGTKPENEIQSNKLLIAANSFADILDKNDVMQESDIPLIEGNDTLHAHIDIVQNSGNAQIAMLEPNTLVSTIEEPDAPEDKTLAEADLKQDEWTQMSNKDENDSPWVVAKGNKFAKNQAVVEYFSQKEDLKEEAPASFDMIEESEKISAVLKPEESVEKEDETKVAYQMIQNLLIPIPEDIMNDANLTPQLTASPKEKSSKSENDAERKAAQKTADGNGLKDSEKQSGLFKSIASWFSGDKKNQTNIGEDTAKKNVGRKSGIDFFGFISGNDENKNTAQILPAELRLSFQPNRAEISGQTLRWIHAFADNVRDNNNMYIEIRIDGTSSFALQKKRLNLLSTILANRGVDFRQINIVFTSREPNSFIIRNIRFNNNEEVVVNKNNSNSYYHPW